MASASLAYEWSDKLGTYYEVAANFNNDDPRGDVVVSGPGYVKILHDDNADGRADRTTLFSSKPASGAHGMVFVGNSDGVSVFDAAGVAGCTPAPIQCSSLAHVDGFWTYQLSIGLGKVFAVDSTGRLHALGLN